MHLSQVCELIAIYLFYDVATGPQAWMAFSKDFKHQNTIVSDGLSKILVEFDLEGMKFRVINNNVALDRLVRNIKSVPSLQAIVVAEITQRKKTKWSPWWVRSCNEVSRYATGVDIGFSFNPIHFYKKLLKYDGKRNYKILTQWRR